MTQEGIWIQEVGQEEPTFIPYSEMDSEARQALIKPVGGFFYRASEFLNLDLPPTPYYIKDWLPKLGKCVIYAPAKAGKTFLVTQIARCIAYGETFLSFPTTKGVVMLVQFELGAEIIQHRLIETRRGYDNIYIGTTFSLNIDTSQGLNQIIEAALAIKPNVIIFDPLYKMMAGDENETADMKRVVNNLDEIIDETKASIFLTHHAGKDVSKGGRGSSVLEDWVDSYIEMKKISKKGEPLRITLNPKALRHAQLPPEEITAEMENYEFKLIEGGNSVKEKIKSFVKNKRELTGTGVERAEILKSGIGSNTSVQKALNELCDEFILAKTGRGEYIYQGEGDDDI